MGNVLPIVHRNKDFQSVVPHLSTDSFGKSAPLAPSSVSSKSALSSAKSIPPSVTPEDGDLSITCNSSEVDNLDFDLTEGQIRRDRMISCENECSQITRFVFVGGQKVAENLSLLREKKISRIVNCSLAVVKNKFENNNEFTYLSLNLVDGKCEDIGWFICQVIQFIVDGCNRDERTLVHCEKGISRSCSFVIAYKMWASSQKWQEAFDYVKRRRIVCSPNTAFTCNLIEWGEILAGQSSTLTIIFRCAYHAKYDPETPVLKACRDPRSRRLLTPTTSMLSPNGVFVIRAQHDGVPRLVVWKGRNASEVTLREAQRLAHAMRGVISHATQVILVRDGMEPDFFLRCFVADGSFDATGVDQFDDWYDVRPSEAEELLPQPTAEEGVSGPLMSPVISRNGSDTSVSLPTLNTTNGKESSVSAGESTPSACISTSNKSKLLQLNLQILTRPADAVEESGSGNQVTAASPSSSQSLSDSLKRTFGVNLPTVNFTSLSRPSSNKVLLDERSLASTLREDSASESSSRYKSASPYLSDQESEVRPVPQVQVASQQMSRKLSFRDNVPDGLVGSDDDHQSMIRSSSRKKVHPSPPSGDLPSASSTPRSSRPSSSDKKLFNSPRVSPLSPNTATTMASQMSQSTLMSPQQVSTSVFSSPIHQSNNVNNHYFSSPTHEYVMGIAEVESSRTSLNSLERKPSRDLVRLTAITGDTLITNSSSMADCNDSCSISSGNVQSTAPTFLPLIDANRVRIEGEQSCRRSLFTDDSQSHTQEQHHIENDSKSLSLRLQIPTLNPAYIEENHQLELPSLTTESVVPNQARTFAKPLLFLAEKVNSQWIWQSMGIYDDQDLEENRLFLLLCPNGYHFVWIGKSFDHGVSLTSQSVREFAAQVDRGDVIQNVFVGAHILSNSFEIVFSGEESEAFWNSFNEGF